MVTRQCVSTVPHRFLMHTASWEFEFSNSYSNSFGVNKGVRKKLTAMRKPLSNLSVTWTLVAWLTGTV